LTITAPPRRLFGESVRRKEDIRFLTGAATYLDDVEVPQSTLHIAFVRSRLAHGRIVGIDGSAALALDGVVRVFTSADLPNAFFPGPQAYTKMTVLPAPHPVFPGDTVRYEGQVVAGVVATSRALAEDGADLVDVSYEELDPILGVRAARNNPVQIHAGVPDNTYVYGSLGSGDVDAAFAAADLVVSRSFHIPRQSMVPMEPRGVVASYDRGMHVLTLWTSSQDVHRPRASISCALGIPEDRIHVILPDVGGSFGQKQLPPAESAIAAHAAMVIGRPVKWVEDRLENFKSAPQGRAVDADIELAVRSDGMLLAIRGTMIGDAGAFTYTNAGNAAHTGATLMTNMYAIPAADIRVLVVATNKVPTNAFRGTGRPEATMMVEGLLEMAARALRMDPLEVRRKNLIRPEAFPYKTPLGLVYDSGNYQRLLETLIEMADFGKLREEQTLARLEGRIFGIGTAMYVERAGGGWESAAASIEPDGRVIVRTGSSSHGQGHETSFRQIAADTLDVPMDDIVLRWRDSHDVLRGLGTYASRSMMMGGSAIYVALQKVRKKATELAAFMLGAPVADVIWEGGRVREPGGKSLSLAEIGTAAYDPAKVPPDFELGLYCTGHFSGQPGYTVGGQVLSVEIDRRTGRLRVGHIYAIDDAGRIINPLLAEGQILGATAQGLGEALFEEARYDETGRHISASFLDYDIMTAASMPSIDAVFVETPSPLNPLGVKGVSEGGNCGAPAAVANAVADALAPLGVGPIDIPFTEEKLWRAIHEATSR
jgi:carbon-monoxide dehydrogenase large subunit